MKDRTEFQPDELWAAGWIRITEVGDENIYFELENGLLGWCKVDGFSWHAVEGRWIQLACSGR